MHGFQTTANMLGQRLALFLLAIVALAGRVPIQAAEFHASWKKLPDRVWVGPDFFANRLQDWKIKDGRLRCDEYRDNHPFRTVALLTHRLDPRRGDFEIRVAMTWDDQSARSGSTATAGLHFGIGGDNVDYRTSALCHHRPASDGGLLLVMHSDGELELRDFAGGVAAKPSRNIWSIGGKVTPEQVPLIAPRTRSAEVPAGSASASSVVIRGRTEGGHVHLSVSSTTATREYTLPAERVTGGLALFGCGGPGRTRPFGFDEWQMSGDGIVAYPDRRFGPVLSVLYTVHGEGLSLTAQLPPVGSSDPQEGTLELRKNSKWEQVARSTLVTDSYTLPFRVPAYRATESTRYRVRYDGTIFEGTIRAEPAAERTVVVAAFTGHKCYTGGLQWNQKGIWFPHQELVDHVSAHDPDLLFFSGDQIYEGDLTGVQSKPLDAAILDYHYKWYRWCWAFGDLTRHRPTVCIPDDHDVYHGNLWGAGGKKAEGKTAMAAQDSGGYKMPPRFVNMVHRTQTSHLPPPADPTANGEGISSYYTSFPWGGLSFAVLADRQWKSSPTVAVPEGDCVNGWFQKDDFDPAKSADVAGAVLLGQRQLDFLDRWATDFSGNTWAKVVLSQTIFSNVATLPARAKSGAVLPSLLIPQIGDYPEGYKLAADADSNGWPQSGRNRALRRMQKGAAVHLAGDQHLGSTIQYGIDGYRDAGFALCVPSIANTWPRRWFPSEPGDRALEYEPRYTGDYRDGFGNRMTVHAVSNPMKYGQEPARLYDAAPGYGIARFDRKTRQVILESWPRWVDPRQPGATPYAGWPVRFPYDAGDGRKPVAWLPTVRVSGMAEPVIRVIAESTGETVYARRSAEPSFRPPLFTLEGKFTIEVGEPGTERWKVFRGQVPGDGVIEVNWQ